MQNYSNKDDRNRQINNKQKILFSPFSIFIKIFHTLPGWKRIRPLFDALTGAENKTWSRVIMQQKTHQIVESLKPHNLKVLEISGDYWKNNNFKEYRTVQYPDFDICENVIQEHFDLIIAEQVFEHLLWPYRAGRNVYRMLEQNGYFLISTPFLVQIHNYPIDCTRWTEIGLKYFLAECGFTLEKIQTDSWGNRSCTEANFRLFGRRYRRRLHSLKNERFFPYHVWAIAGK